MQVPLNSVPKLESLSDDDEEKIILLVSKFCDPGILQAMSCQNFLCS